MMEKNYFFSLFEHGVCHEMENPNPVPTSWSEVEVYFYFHYLTFKQLVLANSLFSPYFGYSTLLLLGKPSYSLFHVVLVGLFIKVPTLPHQKKNITRNVLHILLKMWIINSNITPKEIIHDSSYNINISQWILFKKANLDTLEHKIIKFSLNLRCKDISHPTIPLQSSGLKKED